MRILVGEPIAQQAIAQMEAGGAVVDCLYLTEGVTAEDIIGDYDALVIGSQMQVSETLLAKADKLKVIGKIGKDTSNIDIMAATKAGVAVVNTSEGVSASLAEYNILALLTLARLGTAAGKLGHELKGKTLGIIGLGNVGSQVAKRAKAFDMRVVCYDPSVSRARAMVCDAELMELVDLLVLSDFITLHVPLNQETRGLISTDKLSLVREGTYLINTAEADICDIDAVAAALQSGHLRGVMMDFPGGNDEIQEKLAAFDNAIITTNMAAATAEARMGTAQEVVAEMLAYWETGYSKNAINVPLIKEIHQQPMNMYRRLVQTLGDFIGQLVDKPIETIHISLQGDIAQYEELPLIHWALATLLAHKTQDRINNVNAMVWARDHQIEVTVDKILERGDYQSQMSIEVTAGGETRFIAGHVRANGEIRLVQIDQFTMDAKPESHFLLIPHQNRPGMIGMVGTILGQHGVNIAAMVVGSRLVGSSDTAMMVMTVDQAAQPELIAAISASEGVMAVHDIGLTLF